MVGLCANALGSAGYRGIYIKQSRHPRQATDILATLAALSRFRGVPFEELLYTTMPSLPLGTSVIAITAMPRETIYEALAGLQETGHRVLLLTIGDTEPNVPARIASYHLGGRDAWHRLEAFELD